MEAPTGIEPVYAVVQTAAYPLRQGAAGNLVRDHYTSSGGKH